MTAQHLTSIALRFLAVLALVAGLAGGAARPAAADASQWQMSQPHWWDNSNGWRRHHQWPGQWHHHNQFNGGIHRCFGSCFGPRIIVNGSHVFFISPGLVFGNPAFIVQQPAFIIQQPAFIVRQPAFIVRQPAFIVGGSPLNAGQRAFIARHPSLQQGQPMHMHHGGIHFITPGMDQSGVRFITPGM
jgi:Ni/Co efflux regulator RcnB